MKKLFLSGSLLVALCADAQLVNNGATIVIQPGASVFCAGNFVNTSGTVTNNGKIEVQGNFLNAGTYSSSTNDDSLIMSGAGNVTLNTGGAMLRYLAINKGAGSDLVTLANSVSIADKLDYLAGTLSTDYLANPSYAITAPTTAIFNFGPGREIVGNVRRTGWSNGVPVLFNSANLQMTTNGGVAPSELMATILPEAFGGDPSQTEREVKRKFLFAQTGGSGFTTDIRFPYLSSELNTNAEGNLVPWTLVSSEWNARLTSVNRDAAADWVSTAGIDVTALTQEWKLADPRYTFNVTANLRGSWNGSDMNAGMNSVLPTSQPYNTTPFNYAGTETATIPNANVVDWVLVELRKPVSGLPQDASASTIIGRKAGFLLRNGTIVDMDGTTPLSFDITKQGPSFIAVRHRNHLGVLSNIIASNTIGTFANDFSVLANSYKAAGAPTDPLVLLSGGTKYGLWAGDANKSGTVNITDVNAIKAAISASSTGYQLTDVNLSNSINVTDVNLAKVTISSSGSGSIQGRVAAGKVKTNLPDPLTE
ncbi:MAG TPA: hypothetical protein VER36_05045 [Flavisolibacter sp.]|nr:hypothetical protein [Flavisolibacter sp.]